MKTKDFLKKHNACIDGAQWALSISDDMADVWDAMLIQEKWEWLLWTATRPGVFPDSVLRKLACRFVRETPLSDGRKVWDLLTDERSRKAVEVAEAYADGKATDEELHDARASAYAAARAADADAAAHAARAADADAAYAAAYDAEIAAYAGDHTAYTAADAAYAAAHAAYDAAYAADAAYADDAADAAAAADATNAAEIAAYAAYAHAKAAQIKMIADLGNPFREGREDEK